MRDLPSITVLVLAMLLPACGKQKNTDSTAIENEVMAVLKAQVAAWNAGDIDGFMAGYLNTDSLRFASGGEVTFGWQTTLQRYKKAYPDRAAMGMLDFSETGITVLNSDAALVFGRWRLQRKNDSPNGLFTLLFRKTQDGWFIVQDHTSSSKK